MNVRSSAGQVTGTVVADVKPPQQSAAGTVSVRHLDLGPILNDPKQKSDITADAKLDLHAASFSDANSLHGTVSLDAPRIVAAGFAANQVKGNARIDGRRLTIDGQAAAYGASATAAGRVVLPGEQNATRVAFDLHGQARHVDLRRLPRDLNVPAAATRRQRRISRHGESGHRPTDESSTGDTAFAPIDGRRRQDRCAGATRGFTMNGRNRIRDRRDDRRSGSRSGWARNSVCRRLRRTAIRARSTAMSSRAAAANAGSDNEMDVTASGTLHDTSIMGGRIPQMAFDAAIQQDTAHVKANGSFAGFDPAVASGKPAMKGTVGGTLDVDGTVTNISDGLTPDTVEGTAKINLEPSNVGGLDITSATIDGDYRRSTADLRAFDIVGRDLNVQATARWRSTRPANRT